MCLTEVCVKERKQTGLCIISSANTPKKKSTQNYYILLLCVFVSLSLLGSTLCFQSPVCSQFCLCLSQGFLCHALLPALYEVFVAVMKSGGSADFFQTSAKLLTRINTHSADVDRHYNFLSHTQKSDKKLITFYRL